jgi:hypothetical protein
VSTPRNSPDTAFWEITPVKPRSRQQEYAPWDLSCNERLEGSSFQMATGGIQQ